MSKKMWMIRAGRGALLAEDFEANNYVAVGWDELNDLSSIKTKDELKKIYKESSYGNDKIGKQRIDFGQIYRFRFEVKPGDFVLTYNSELRNYLLGEIDSDYEYIPNSPGNYNHVRKVKWLGKVRRDSLSVETRNTVGAIMTIFLLGKSAQDEFIKLKDGKVPLQQKDKKAEELEELKKGIMEKAFEFTKDNILSLDWDQMQELVAGILRAMGYKTRVASPGPDRGVDIIASPDGLGLEQPRIRVEVKHRTDTTIGAQLLRSFLGGLRQNDRGLYVSTGGFSREARYEAERSPIPVTLLDIDDLADLLIKNYDNVDTETKALIPMVKLYWPA